MIIPDNIYGTVFNFVIAITNATHADDTRNVWRLYGELRAYCEEQLEAGMDPTFLWKTLADFTTDDNIAAGLYLKALEQAELRGSSYYEATILLSLAERHSKLGDKAQSLDYAARANEKARGLDDLDLRRSISQFLLDVSKNT